MQDGVELPSNLPKPETGLEQILGRRGLFHLKALERGYAIIGNPDQASGQAGVVKLDERGEPVEPPPKPVEPSPVVPTPEPKPVPSAPQPFPIKLQPVEPPRPPVRPTGPIPEIPSQAPPAPAPQPETPPMTPEQREVAPPDEVLEPVEPEPEPEPEPESIPEAEETVPEKLTMVIAGDTHSKLDSERRGVPFQMTLGQQMSQSVLGLPGRAAKNFLSGIYQRTFLQPWFEEREARWRRTVLDKTGLPDLPDELVEEAIKKGRGELRNKRNLIHRAIDRFYNFGVNLIGWNTTDMIDAQKWLVEEVEKAKRGEPTSTVLNQGKTVGDIFLDRALHKEAFAGRLAGKILAPEEQPAKGERFRAITDEALKGQLVEDLFKLFTPYINGSMTDEQALRLMEQYADGGAEIAGVRLRLQERFAGDEYRFLRSRLSTIGTNMRRLAKVYSQKERAGQVNLWQKLGKVENAASAESWIQAYRDGKLDIDFYLAEADITPGARREKAIERALKGISERVPENIRRGFVGNAANWVWRMASSLGLNEVVAAHVGGYGGAFLESFIPTSMAKATWMAGVVGLPAVPVLIATTSIGWPVAIPVIAASAAAAGVFAGVREVARLWREVKSVEWDASVGKLNADIKVKPGLFHRLMRRVYGATERKTMVEKIAHQRPTSEILTGLTTQSGLFTNSSELTSALTFEMIQNLTPDKVQKALRWYNEYKAREHSEIEKDRRFFRFDLAQSEGEQREILAGAAHEVYERLQRVFDQRQDLRGQFFVDGVSNLRELCTKLEEAYRYNLIGGGIFGRQKASAEATALVNLLAATDADKGFISSKENLSSRNWALGRLYTRAFFHRAIGTVATAVAFGDIWAEAQHKLVGTPPSMIIGGMLGEHQQVLAPGAGPGAEFAWNDLQHLQLPNGFVKEPLTNIVNAPDDSVFDLNNFRQANGDLNVKDLSDYLHTHYNINQLSPDHQDFFTQPSHPNEFKLPNGDVIVVNTPGEVDLDPNKDGLLNSIKIGSDTYDLAKELHLGHAFNPADSADVVALKTFLESKHLEFTTSAGGSIVKVEPIPGGSVEHIPYDDVWRKLVHPIDRRQWYSYDQPGSQGNELGFHTYRDGDAVILDMSKMKDAYQQGLPSPIHVGQLNENDHDDGLGWYFSIPGEGKEGVFVLDSADGKIDKMLRLDPNDNSNVLTLLDKSKITLGEFSKMLLNRDAVRRAEGSAMPGGLVNIATELRQQREVFNAKWIEAGLIRNVGGKQEFDAFATIGGEHRAFTGEITRKIAETLHKYTVEAVSGKYDIYKFELPGVTRPGEVVIGVMPAPYTDYAWLGEQSQRTTRAGVSPLPPYRTRREGAPEVIPPPQPPATPPAGQRTQAATITSEERARLVARRDELSRKEAGLRLAIEQALRLAPDERPSRETERELGLVQAELANIEVELQAAIEISRELRFVAHVSEKADHKIEEKLRFGPFEVSAGTDVGKKRKLNEDNYLLLRIDDLKETLMVVADGMGGAAQGKEASNRAVEVIKEAYLKERKDGKSQDAALKLAVEETNRLIYAARQQANDDRGTTCVAAVLSDNGKDFVANVGDSRAGRIVGKKILGTVVGKLERISKDHSLVQTLIESRQIEEKDRRTDPQRNVIFKNLGDKRDVEVDMFPVELNQGEYLVLNSDGLWEMVDDDDITKMVLGKKDPKSAVEKLIDAANNNGGDDNVTVIIAKRLVQH